ncbi:MAG: peptidoglycan endopeptidase [Lachnospiraceae bacterium]|jgi:uncharacterized protein YgiM (DUF1202 family)|nr:peptidoglycan endopeptidase [Lachnospiraceae bacterium]
MQYKKIRKILVTAVLTTVLTINTGIPAGADVIPEVGAGTVNTIETVDVSDLLNTSTLEKQPETGSADFHIPSTKTESTDNTPTESGEVKEESTVMVSELPLASAGAGSILEDDISAGDGEDSEEEGANCGYTNLGVANVEDHLNIRATASPDSELVGKMTKNAGCEVLAIEGNMARISSGSVEGYVSLDYLLTGQSAKERAEEVKEKIATVNADGLKLREQPTTECETAGMVAYGESLSVVDDTLDGWVAVNYDGQTVYVSADYVTIEEKLKTALNMSEVLYGEGVSDVRVALCEYAKQFLGNPYVWGGTSLTHGADCSGFVLSIFAKYGIYLPHSSRAQSQMGTKVDLANARPGDLVFYAKGGRVNHVGIYIGGGQIINASSPRTGIRIANVYYRTPVAVRRIIPD